MKISIVTPAYNAASYLSKTLDSVLAQTFTDWELVVVDDGSTDGTYSIASAFASRHERIRVVQQVNGGVATARNTGFAHTDCDSECVIFLDHDDVWCKEALSILWSALSAHPQAVATHGLARKVNAEGRPLGTGKAAIQNPVRRTMVGGLTVTSSPCDPTMTAHILCDNWICTPGLALVRRAALGQMINAGQALFDKDAVPLDDWDFWLRLSLCGDLAFVDNVLLDWRRHAAAGSLNTSVMSQAELRMRGRMCTMPELSQEQRRVARVQYEQLLTTRRRRAAYDLWKAARRSITQGRIPTAFWQFGEAVSNYAHYVRGRRRSNSELWNES